MTAVKLKGTFSKTERDSNGLEDISHDLVKNEFTRYLVVGMVEQHKVTKEPGEAPIPTARFVAIEVARGDDEETARAILDRARKGRGLGNIADTLFTAAREDFDFDGPAPELEGQQELRLGADGEHEVPLPSGEELTAELDERRAAKKPATDPFTPGDAA
jgi:hypothetical protein